MIKPNGLATFCANVVAKIQNLRCDRSSRVMGFVKVSIEIIEVSGFPADTEICQISAHSRAQNPISGFSREFHLKLAQSSREHVRPSSGVAQAFAGIYALFLSDFAVGPCTNPEHRLEGQQLWSEASAQRGGGMEVGSGLASHAAKSNIFRSPHESSEKSIQFRNQPFDWRSR